ncbi:MULTISPECIES: acyl carrier protein [unclassified Paraburkholderia]|uniref:acyl carrier protein n=1 Tax=unclassified Paraburkholderia TaxID=2615204 RepID=UPI00161691CF|nr:MULTISPECIES: phosphopantetheine-binding protein [unclassified Paraburkholderia]MBB5447902.1 acyl carrier protein [Paraburkholderia sp. WSM4177]MBB5488318.1 acyl carrier protein [Paraburkholderia sp. WSM4180]
MASTSKNASTRNTVFGVVRTQLLRVCREHQRDFNTEIRLDSSLIADLGLDSLSLVEAVVAIEQAFGIERLPLEALNEERAETYFTVGSLVDLCIRHAAVRVDANEGLRT